MLDNIRIAIEQQRADAFGQAAADETTRRAQELQDRAVDPEIRGGTRGQVEGVLDPFGGAETVADEFETVFENIDVSFLEELNLGLTQFVETAGQAALGFSRARAGLAALGFEAPEEIERLNEVAEGLENLYSVFTSGNPIQQGVAAFTALVTVMDSLTGRISRAEREMIRLREALAEVSVEVDNIVQSAFSGTQQLNQLQVQSTQAIRDQIADLTSIQEVESFSNLVLGALARAGIDRTIEGLQNATNQQLLSLGDELSDLFEALGVRIQDQPTNLDFDPSELRQAQNDFLRPIRTFAEQLAQAFGADAALDSVISQSVRLADATEDLTNVITQLTAAEESQIRETFNLERINIRAQAQRQFQAAGADPFEQARIFEQLRGQLEAVTEAENAALESARAIAAGGDDPSRISGLATSNLPVIEDQTEEIQNYLTRIDELTQRVQFLDFTSEQGLEQFFALAREFRTIFFEAAATFDELPPVLEQALSAANVIFAVAGQAAAQAFREGVAQEIEQLPPEVVDSQQIIQVRPSPLGDGTWDVFFIGGPDGIDLPPELGVDSDRILEIGALQELDEWNKLFVGGGGDQVLPEGLTADSARVFKIVGVQDIDQWQAIYAAASGDDVLPVTITDNSNRVFTIESLQSLDDWTAIYQSVQGGPFAGQGSGVLPVPLLDNSERVFQINSLQTLAGWHDIYNSVQAGPFASLGGQGVLPTPILVNSSRIVQINSRQTLTTEDLFSFNLQPRLIEASQLVRVVGRVSVPVAPEVEETGPSGRNPSTESGA